MYRMTGSFGNAIPRGDTGRHLGSPTLTWPRIAYLALWKPETRGEDDALLAGFHGERIPVSGGRRGDPRVASPSPRCEAGPPPRVARLLPHLHFSVRWPTSKRRARRPRRSSGAWRSWRPRPPSGTSSGGTATRSCSSTTRPGKRRRQPPARLNGEGVQAAKETWTTTCQRTPPPTPSFWKRPARGLAAATGEGMSGGARDVVLGDGGPQLVADQVEGRRPIRNVRLNSDYGKSALLQLAS